MNKFQKLFEKFGFDLESDNNSAELCDELYELYKTEKAKRIIDAQERIIRKSNPGKKRK